MPGGAKNAGSKGPGASPSSSSAHRLVARLLDLIKRNGGNIAAVLAEKGHAGPLKRFVENDLPFMEGPQLQSLSAYASVVVGDIHSRKVGRDPFRSTDWHVLFFCLIGSRTLREAILRMEELFPSLDGRLGTAYLLRSGNTAKLELGGERSDNQELDFTVLLHGYLMFHSVLSWLIGKSLGGRVALAMPESMRTYVVGETLPFELTLDAPRSAMTFAANLLEQPVIRTMEDMDSMPSLNFMVGLRSEDIPEEIARKTYQIMAACLREKHRLPSMDEAADILSTSRVTLRRRLQAARTSFRALRNEVRRDRSMDLLVKGTHSIEEIAEWVDFCDSDSFRLAFRGWTGMSPTKFRKSALAGDA